jgi:hypothetical protein
MYKLPSLTFGQTEPSSVIRLSDNACIPFADDNTDCQAYLAWVAKGNKPISADEVTE